MDNENPILWINWSYAIDWLQKTLKNQVKGPRWLRWILHHSISIFMA